nr:hypothetical protein CFP56_18750 [Quercus suber]
MLLIFIGFAGVGAFGALIIERMHEPMPKAVKALRIVAEASMLLALVIVTLLSAAALFARLKKVQSGIDGLAHVLLLFAQKLLWTFRQSWVHYKLSGIVFSSSPFQVVLASAFISASNFVLAINFSFSTVMGLGDMVEGRHEAEMCAIAESEYACSPMFKRQ